MKPEAAKHRSLCLILALGSVAFLLYCFMNLDTKPQIEAIASYDAHMSNNDAPYDPHNSWLISHTGQAAIRSAKTTQELVAEFDRTFRADLDEALKPQNRLITLIVTSCDRFDLLNRTLSSFDRTNPVSRKLITERIIVDDCKSVSMADKLVKRYFPEYYLVLNGNDTLDAERFAGKERSQIVEYHIMRANRIVHDMVRTPWTIMMEDDWEYKNLEFVSNAFKVFESVSHEWKNMSRQKKVKGQWQGIHTPYNIIGKVMCRNDHCAELDSPKDCRKIKNKMDFESLHSYKNMTWRVVNYEHEPFGGWAHNAGLFPTFIYKKWIGPFEGDRMHASEAALATYGKRYSMHVAYASRREPLEPFCIHIGDKRHVG